MYFLKHYGYLSHHGIKGQKWGVRNGPPYPIEDNSISIPKGRKSTNFNLDKLGKSKNTNILFITGMSGSGKSTKAIQIANANDAEIIHLDPYIEMDINSKGKIYNKNFNKFLNKNFPEYKKRPPSKTKELGKWFDKYETTILNYGKSLYPNKKLIVEGIQILDSGFMPYKNFFKDKPLMIMNTNVLKSQLSASLRDSENIIDFMKVMSSKENWDFRKLWKKYESTLINDIENNTDLLSEMLKEA